MSESPGSGGPMRPNGEETTPVASTRDPHEHMDGDPMDITIPGPGSMGPPAHSSPDIDAHPHMTNGVLGEASHGQQNGMSSGLNAAAATSAQQPKVVQTAFIHKLYSMLEDNTIQHLISWSNNNESFVMSPSADFGKTLSQYFKHTNISSFVRQLNMYGFHKVSDVFHTGSPDSTLWEFKHGNGSFRRGDLASLREIKRRASRHTLMHKESYNMPTPHKPSISHPGTPAEPILDPEARLLQLEQTMFDIHARLMRTEESNTALSAKCHTLNESLVKAHQWNLDMTHLISAMIPEPDHPIRRDASVMERDISRQMDLIRNYEDPHESLMSGRQPYFSNMALAEPSSPRTGSIEERRPSLHAIPPRQSALRPQPPPPPSQSSVMPQRRYGSIGTAQQPLPNYHRPYQAQTQIPQSMPQHPLANVSEPGPNMGRRHTSADIRVPGWPPQSQGSPTSGQSSGHWPSSPTHSSDQHVRDQLASYEFGRSRTNFGSHQETPPSLSHDTTPSTLSVDSTWSWANSSSKFPPRILDSAPQTRRSSMASNVHSLLNPAETAERDEEDPLGDERKRKRLL